VIATGVSLVLFCLDVRNAPVNSGNDTDPCADAAADESSLLEQDLSVP